MKIAPKRLLIALVFLVIAALVAFLLFEAFYEPPPEIKMVSAKVIRYGKEVSVLLVDIAGTAVEVQVESTYPVQTNTEASLSAAELLPGQSILLHKQVMQAVPSIYIPMLTPEGQSHFWGLMGIELSE